MPSPYKVGTFIQEQHKIPLKTAKKNYHKLSNMLAQRPKSPNVNIDMSRNLASIPAMSVKTRHFIRKICFQQAASVDMTKYGFVRDSKMQPINLMLKPLKDQLEKIIGNTKSQPTTPQSIIKQSSSTRKDEKRSVNFEDEKEKLSRPRQSKKNNSKVSIPIKSKKKRTKTNKVPGT